MRVSAAEFTKRFGELSDEALAQPLIITRHGRDRLVVMSLAKYRELTNPGEAKRARKRRTSSFGKTSGRQAICHEQARPTHPLKPSVEV
jgi:prevent-host-death family protein